MDDEHDVEVFERIPWESLEERTDRRWLVYLIAGVAILAAIGISLGRQLGRTPRPPLSAPATTVAGSPEESVPPTTLQTTPSTTVQTTPSTTVQTTTPAPIWSEADLMALPADSISIAAAAIAEWFVIEFFTRDDPDGDRSFVEWARASELEWLTPSEIRVKVLVRRLAAIGDEPYQRLETEAWGVVAELRDGGWAVIEGPVQGEPPALVADGSGPGGSGRDPTAAEEWVDAAGVVWQVTGPVERGGTG